MQLSTVSHSSGVTESGSGSGVAPPRDDSVFTSHTVFAPSYIPTYGAEGSSLIPDEGASELHSMRPTERRSQRHVVLGRRCSGSSQSPHICPSPWPPHALCTPPPLSDPGLVCLSTQAPSSVPAPALVAPAFGGPLPWASLALSLSLFPFCFSSCPPLSLYVWDVSQVLVPTQCLIASCVLNFTAAAF